MDSMVLTNTRIHKFAICALALIVLLVSAACSAGSAGTEEDKDQVVNVIKWNLYYAQAEDLSGYMRTIHADSPARVDTQNAMKMIFREFTLSYQLVDYEIISISNNSADIRVTQDTLKVAGELPFRDNRLTAIHTLKKSDDGKWKIYHSEMEDVHYYN
jgi:ABC-type glycerol-3-phosphate transport system substrate-binding protein